MSGRWEAGGLRDTVRSLVDAADYLSGSISTDVVDESISEARAIVMQIDAIKMRVGTLIRESELAGNE